MYKNRWNSKNTPKHALPSTANCTTLRRLPARAAQATAKRPKITASAAMPPPKRHTGTVTTERAIKPVSFSNFSVRPVKPSSWPTPWASMPKYPTCSSLPTVTLLAPVAAA